MAADLRTVFSTVIVHWINKLSLKPPAFKHEHSGNLKTYSNLQTSSKSKK